MIYIIIAVLLLMACYILFKKPKSLVNHKTTINILKSGCGGCSNRIPIKDGILCIFKGETIYWDTSKTTRLNLMGKKKTTVEVKDLPKVILTDHGYYPEGNQYRYIGSIGGRGRPKCDAVCTDVYILEDG